MVLCQFVVNNGSNGGWFDVNINGTCNARLVNYIFAHNNPAIFQVQSDVFKVPYSSGIVSKGFILANSGMFAFDQSHKDYHWNNVVIPGRVQFTVIDTTNLAPFAGNWTLVLTFDIENLP
jgi:hypothetical protein